MNLLSRSTIWLAVTAALAMLVGVFLVSPTKAEEVKPVLVGGNPNCEELNGSPDPAFDNVTSDFGFKIDKAPNGTFSFIDSPPTTELTGGAPSDPNNSVTISGSDGKIFDWLATLTIDAVIVKAQNANAYVYVPEASGDDNLNAPERKDISHIEFCYDYELTASKTANATYTRTYSWTIGKSASLTSHSGFAGDTFSSSYDVSVDQTITDSGFAVSGSITVNNPAPFPVSFGVSDSVGGTPAAVDCDPNANGNQSSGTLASGASTTCTYSASLGSKTNGTNTATITSNTAGVGGTTATAGYTFGDPTTVVGPSTIKATDSFKGNLGEASADQTFTYSRSFSCSSNPSDYTNGARSDLYPNTATIVETGQSASASVTVNCYAPVVSKDASTEWNKKYEWSITKTANPTTHTALSGDSFSSSYSVVVDQTITNYGFKAFGTISVSNPGSAPASMTVNVADAVNGYAATVNCGGGSTSLTVAAGATRTCSYTVNLPDNTDRTNTASVTLNDANFPATAAVDFGDPIIEGPSTIKVTDSFKGNLGEASADKTFPTYSRSFSCSSNPSDYTNGARSDLYPNTATIVETGQSASASVTVNCSLKGKVTVKKTTNKAVDKSKDIKFVLTGPGLPSGSVTLSTLGDEDGVLDFGYALGPGSQYTVCENPVPAGFTSFWTLDGTIVTPYNPDASKSPPEDTGVRCFNFSASAGQTRAFEVDNSRPGGDPRTIGYWKNWNKCASGNQAATAAKNGGAAAGFFILEDLLPQLVGDFNITTCTQAVKLLSKQDQNGTNRASDAAYELAAQLLAAKLNLAAGAETCSGVQTAVTNGQALLDQINFTGSGTYLGKSSTNRTNALNTAATLDKYNNGNLC